VMQADVERLERVSRRFELIGKPPALERIEAADVMHELVSYFRPRLPHLGKGITLRARVHPDLPPIRANQVLLVWALENIIKNAIDALAGRGGRISFMAMRGGRPPVAGTSPDSLHLVITDDGPGIAPPVRDRKSTRLNSSHVKISYAVFCLKKKRIIKNNEVTILI